MAILGKLNRLTVLKDSSPGLYLDGGELGEILLPGDAIPNLTSPPIFCNLFKNNKSAPKYSK